MSRLLLIFGLWSIYLAAFSSLAHNVTFVTEDLPPLQIAGKNSQPTGAMVDLIKEIIKEANFNASVISLPWARAYKTAQNSENTFIFSMLRSKEREALFQWVGQIYTIRPFLAGLRESRDIDIDSFTEAKPYKVGVIRHALSETYLLDNGFVINENIYTSQSYSSLWHNLYNGYTDLTFTNHIIWKPQIIKAGLDPKQIKLITDINGFSTQMYLAASKKTAPELVKNAQTALKNIKADGRYDKILEKWQLN